MNVFISGGCKNGKSLHAQELARDMARESSRPMYYIATMIPKDAEDDARIVKHLEAREGWGFITLEQPVDLTAILDREDVDLTGAFLLDSVTALLSNEMFRDDGSYDAEAGARVSEDLLRFAAGTGNTVFVSDYIYADAGHYDEMTDNYIRSLAACDRALAGTCERVIETSFGVFRDLKQ